jgi:hypothetical protein
MTQIPKKRCLGAPRESRRPGTPWSARKEGRRGLSGRKNNVYRKGHLEEGERKESHKI